MHKYTDRVICDGCGKNLRGEDYGTIFSPRNHPVTIFKACRIMDYDFCNDCYKKAKKALDDICKKEK